MTTIDSNTKHWWEVNLEQSAKIASISIQITASYQKKIIIETKLDGGSFVLCERIDAPDAAVNEITCNTQTTAQYLRITETSNIGYLDLSEFKVFGTFI